MNDNPIAKLQSLKLDWRQVSCKVEIAQKPDNSRLAREVKVISLTQRQTDRHTQTAQDIATLFIFGLQYDRHTTSQVAGWAKTHYEAEATAGTQRELEKSVRRLAASLYWYGDVENADRLKAKWRQIAKSQHMAEDVDTTAGHLWFEHATAIVYPIAERVDRDPGAWVLPRAMTLSWQDGATLQVEIGGLPFVDITVIETGPTGIIMGYLNAALRLTNLILGVFTLSQSDKPLAFAELPYQWTIKKKQRIYKQLIADLSQMIRDTPRENTRLRGGLEKLKDDCALRCGTFTRLVELSEERTDNGNILIDILSGSADEEILYPFIPREGNGAPD